MMEQVIDLLAQAGVDGNMVALTGADVAGTAGAALARGDADALAVALKLKRHLACLVVAPDNEPSEQDAPARPDEDQPETPDIRAA